MDSCKIPVIVSDMQATEATIYALHINTIESIDCGHLSLLMPRRMEKAGRYRLQRDQLLSIGAGILLSEVMGIKDESVLQYGEYGKPYAEGYPAFSISHSGEWCVLAAGGSDPVGVDIEKMNGSDLRAARAFLTNDERRWIERDPLYRFHLLWVWKESLLKAVGSGMAIDPRSVSVLPFASGNPVRLSGKDWSAVSGSIGDYRYSVCSTRRYNAVKWEELRFYGKNCL